MVTRGEGDDGEGDEGEGEEGEEGEGAVDGASGHDLVHRGRGLKVTLPPQLSALPLPSKGLCRRRVRRLFAVAVTAAVAAQRGRCCRRGRAAATAAGRERRGEVSAADTALATPVAAAVATAPQRRVNLCFEEQREETREKAEERRRCRRCRE